MSPKRSVGVEDDWEAVHDGERHLSALPHLDDNVSQHYSVELLQLVYSCVEYDQDARPSFSSLRREIFRRTRGPGGLQQNDLANGMRASTHQEVASVGLKPDPYGIGNTLPP
jgi:hypothetical protein